jgi:hypothetical protein
MRPWACRSGLQKMDFEAWLEIVARFDAKAAKNEQFVIGSIILADLDAAVDMARQTSGTFSRFPVERSSRMRTECPAVPRASHRWDPMNPHPPVTRYLAKTFPPVSICES